MQELRFDFEDRTMSMSEKLLELSAGESSLAFRNIARDRNGSTTKLAR